MDLFEWDENKNHSNNKRHGISFEEAIEIFKGDIFTRIDYREDYDEVREISIGAIEGVIVLVVVHADRDNQTRIISARRANKKERQIYFEYLSGTT